MTNTGRKVTAALVAAAAMMMVEPVSAQGEPIDATGEREATIVLHVTNYADLSREALEGAMARVATIYERIGVRVAWVDDMGSVRRHADGELHLTVLLLSREMADRTISGQDLKDGVLGQAHPPSGRASIFCERIATMLGASTYLANPLGDVIAHEVGHLLLGANSHSPSGIMRPHVNARGLHPLQSFDMTQARTIRTTFMALTAATKGGERTQ